MVSTETAYTMIRPLSKELQSHVLSGVTITSYTQCVEELVLNSIDASSTCIAVRVDFDSHKIQVVDNGHGMSPDQLRLIGQRYHTSKCHHIQDLDNLGYFGFRGEALASIRDTSAILEIVSRQKSSTHTYVSIFQDGKATDLSECKTHRPSTGTTITVRDMFHCMPVRRKSLNEVLEMERIHQRLQCIALIHPEISISLRNDQFGTMLLQTHKSKSVFGAFTHLFGHNKAKVLSEISFEDKELKIHGYIGKEAHVNKNLQFVYINDRLVLRTKIHQLVNNLLRNTLIVSKRVPWTKPLSDVRNPNYSSPEKLADKYGIFILNIACGLSLYDITFEPSKTLVEFRNWDQTLKCVQTCITDFLRRENLVISIDSQDSAHQNAELLLLNDETSQGSVLLSIDCEGDVPGHSNCNPRTNVPTICVSNMLNSMQSLVARRHSVQIDVPPSPLCSDTNAIEVDILEVISGTDDLGGVDSCVPQDTNVVAMEDVLPVIKQESAETSQEIEKNVQVQSCRSLISSSDTEQVPMIMSDTGSKSDYENESPLSDNVLSCPLPLTDMTNSCMMYECSEKQCSKEASDITSADSQDKRINRPPNMPHIVVCPSTNSSPDGYISSLQKFRSTISSNHQMDDIGASSRTQSKQLRGTLQKFRKRAGLKQPAGKLSDLIELRHSILHPVRQRKREHESGISEHISDVKEKKVSTCTKCLQTEGSSQAFVYEKKFTKPNYYGYECPPDKGGIEVASKKTIRKNKYNLTRASTVFNKPCLRARRKLVKQIDPKFLSTETMIQTAQNTNFDEAAKKFPVEQTDDRCQSSQLERQGIQLDLTDLAPQILKGNNSYVMESNTPACSETMQDQLCLCSSDRSSWIERCSPTLSGSNGLHPDEAFDVCNNIYDGGVDDSLVYSDEQSNDNDICSDGLDPIEFADLQDPTLSNPSTLSPQFKNTYLARDILSIFSPTLEPTTPKRDDDELCDTCSSPIPLKPDMTVNYPDNKHATQCVTSSPVKYHALQESHEPRHTAAEFHCKSHVNLYDASSACEADASSRDSIAADDRLHQGFIASSEGFDPVCDHNNEGFQVDIDNCVPSKNHDKPDSSMCKETIADSPGFDVSYLYQSQGFSVNPQVEAPMEDALSSEEETNCSQGFQINEVDCERACKDSSSPGNTPSRSSSTNETPSNDRCIDVGSQERWKSVTDENTGKRFFINLVTGKTSQNEPGVQPKSMSVESESSEQGPFCLVRHPLLTHNAAAFVNERREKVNASQPISPSSTMLADMFKKHKSVRDSDGGIKWRLGKVESCDDVNASRVLPLLQDWTNPVFKRCEQDVVSTDMSQAKHGQVKVHSLLNPCKFDKDLFNDIEVLGQVDNKFIACLVNNQSEDSKNICKYQGRSLLVLFDQHAVHERVRLEQILNDIYEVNQNGVQRVNLSVVNPAVEVCLSAEEVRIAKAYKKKFMGIGISFSTTNRPDVLLVDSVPMCLVERQDSKIEKENPTVAMDTLQTLIRDHVQLLRTTKGASASLPKVLSQIVNSQACHGAIKFGDHLSLNECQALLKSLSQCNLPFQCAHGRPSLAPILDIHKLISRLKTKENEKPALWKLHRRNWITLPND